MIPDTDPEKVKSLKKIRSYYHEFQEISSDGYVRLEIAALILDMIALLGQPTLEQLIYIFRSKEKAETIANLYHITHHKEAKQPSKYNQITLKINVEPEAAIYYLRQTASSQAKIVGSVKAGDKVKRISPPWNEHIQIQTLTGATGYIPTSLTNYKPSPWG